MLSKKDIREIKEAIVPEIMNVISFRFDAVDRKLGEHTVSLIQLRSDLGSLQDVVMGINSYIETELKVSLFSIDEKISKLSSRVGLVEKRSID